MTSLALKKNQMIVIYKKRNVYLMVLLAMMIQIMRLSVIQNMKQFRIYTFMMNKTLSLPELS